MKKVSVLTPTYRALAQLETVKESLLKQTMPPEHFEWVIVDDHYEEHRTEVKAWGLPFDVVHVPPRRLVEQAAGCMARNTGFAHSRGDLVFIVNDYVQLTNPVLERHYELFERYGPKVLISGPFLPAECPRCTDSPSIPREIWVKPCQRCGREMVVFQGRSIELSYHDEGVGEIRSRDLAGNFYAGLNDSVGLEATLDVNGMDERRDGYSLGGDFDFAVRLLNSGCRYIIDRLVPCIVHPHTRGKAYSESYPDVTSFLESMDHDQTWADHGWSIREERAKVQT